MDSTIFLTILLVAGLSWPLWWSFDRALDYYDGWDRPKDRTLASLHWLIMAGLFTLIILGAALVSP